VNNKKTEESLEDYIETIYLLTQNNSSFHSIDLVKHLNYSKPSISRAIHKLVDLGFLIIDEENHLHLTLSGLQKAKSIYARHLTIKRFLLSIGLEEEIAEKDACRIEHVISEETFDVLQKIIGEKHE
jgi:Mn-dependent DtxR family transcriptional regulator